MPSSKPGHSKRTAFKQMLAHTMHAPGHHMPPLNSVLILDVFNFIM